VIWGGPSTWYGARLAAASTSRFGVEGGKVGLGTGAHRKPDAGEVRQLAVRRDAGGTGRGRRREYTRSATRSMQAHAFCRRLTT
jgi:hypothetical protein